MSESLKRMVAAAVARATRDASQRGRLTGRTPAESRSESAGSQRAGRRIPSAAFEGC